MAPSLQDHAILVEPCTSLLEKAVLTKFWQQDWQQTPVKFGLRSMILILSS